MLLSLQIFTVVNAQMLNKYPSHLVTLQSPSTRNVFQQIFLVLGGVEGSRYMFVWNSWLSFRGVLQMLYLSTLISRRREKKLNIKNATKNSDNSLITVVKIYTKKLNCSLYLMYWNNFVRQPNKITSSIIFSASF